MPHELTNAIIKQITELTTSAEVLLSDLPLESKYLPKDGRSAQSFNGFDPFNANILRDNIASLNGPLKCGK